MSVFSGATNITEPEWKYLYDDALDMKLASEYWHRIRDELSSRELLMPANLHAMKRLTLSYVNYDKAANEVAANGTVVKGLEGRINRINPYFQIMREASADADRMEAELGLAPRRRASATKAENLLKKHGSRASNGYLPARAIAAANNR